MKDLGIDIGIRPGLARGIFGLAMSQALNSLKQHENLQDIQGQIWSGKQYNAALGLAELEDWEKQFNEINQ
jgi:hypothetical protein